MSKRYAFKSIDDIKRIVRQGSVVHWASRAYVVTEDRLGQFLVTCTHNNSSIGLTNRKGDVLNGKLEDFFIGSQETK